MVDKSSSLDATPAPPYEKVVAEDKGVRPSTAGGDDQRIINVIENPLKVNSKVTGASLTPAATVQCAKETPAINIPANP